MCFGHSQPLFTFNPSPLSHPVPSSLYTIALLLHAPFFLIWIPHWRVFMSGCSSVLVSRSTHFPASLLSYLWLRKTPLCISAPFPFPFICWWAPRVLHHLATMDNGNKQGCRSLCFMLILILLGITPRNEVSRLYENLLSWFWFDLVWVFGFLRNLHTYFHPGWLVYILPADTYTSLPAFVGVIFLDDSHSNWDEYNAM